MIHRASEGSEAKPIFNTDDELSFRLQQSRNRGEKLTLKSGRRARIRPFAHPLEHTIDYDEVERAVEKWKFQCSRLRKMYVRDLILKETFASEFDTRRYGIYRVDV